MTDVSVLFATISGRTRKVALKLVEELSPLSCELIELRDGLDKIGKSKKLWIFGSPTYGVGEWHYLWGKYAVRFSDLGVDWSEQAVAVFALGDMKHHPGSFAGAILKLRDFVQRLGANLVGQFPADESHHSVLCEPLLVHGKFPGLVLDQVKQSRLAEQRIQKWAAQLKQEVRAFAQQQS